MQKHYKKLALKAAEIVVCGLWGVISFSTVASAEFIDRVLVIVDESVITQSEFDHRMVTVKGEMKRNGGTALPADINKQLLDGMIADRLQIQEAQRRGIGISDEELGNAIQRFAAQQKMNIPQLVESIEVQGQSFLQFGESVRDSLTISRLTEYYAQTRVTVPDYEIDGWIAQNKLSDSGVEYQIAHILLNDPQENMPLAQQILRELNDGLSFQEAVDKYSEATDASEGGVIGWRTASQLPEIFATAIKPVSVGEVTDVLQSPNGLHILKLLDTKGDVLEVLQSKVRHILIGAKTQVAKAQAAKKLRAIRKRIQAGEEFSQLARIYSDDSVSAANGGDLGWVSPGEMVPTFEQTYETLKLNEVSKPIETQFGMHIVEVLQRRQKNITTQTIRMRAENVLRRQRAEREFKQWVRELREQAYIEHVSEPA